MRAEAPIFYEIEYIKPRSVNETKAICSEWIPLEIREVTDLEAPVAFRSEDERPDSEIRFFGGRLYSPYYENGGVLIGAKPGMFERGQNPEYHALGVPTSFSKRKEMMTKSLGAQFDIQAKEIIRSSRSSAIAKAAELAREIIIVDGRPFRVSGEMSYCVGVRDSNDCFVNICAINRNGDPWYDTGIKRGIHVFRADRYQDAIDHARECGYRIQSQCNPVDILIPEVVRLDDETVSLLGNARWVLSETRKSLTDLTGSQPLDAYLELKEALEAAEVDRSADNMNALHECLGRHRFVPDTDPFVARMIGDALRRWDQRPVTLTEDATFRP